MLCIKVLTCGHKIEDAIPTKSRSKMAANQGEFSMLDLTNPSHFGQAVRYGVEDWYHRATLSLSIFRSSPISIVCPQRGHGFIKVGEKNVRISIGSNEAVEKISWQHPAVNYTE